MKVRSESLTLLLEALKELNSDIELATALQKALQITCAVVKAEAGTLWLLDETTGEVQAEVAHGPAAKRILKVKLKPGEGIVGRVIKHGNSEYIRDVKQDQNWAKWVDQESGFVTHSIITVPLRTKSLLIGAMQLINKQGEEARLFTADDLWLAETVANQAALAISNSRLYDEVQRFSTSAIRSLTLALDARDPYTAGHSGRVSQYSLWIAERMGLTEAERRELERAALMHDIGKIAVPDQILRKPGSLSDKEFEIMQQHPVNASKILAGIEPQHAMETASAVARYHHEKFDGNGYPDGLKNTEIPLFARIVAVADAFDAMTTNRPYGNGRSFKEATLELLRCRGSHFDPEIVDIFAKIMQERSYLIADQERTKVNEPI